MFNIGAAELILLLLIAFVVVGPKDLPKIARAIGRFVRYIREMIAEIKKETGFDEVAEELKGVERDVRQTIKSADIRPDLQKTQLEINKELKSIEKDVSFKELKKEIETDVKQAAQAADIRPDLEKAKVEINKELKSVEKDVSSNDMKKDIGGKEK